MNGARPLSDDEIKAVLAYLDCHRNPLRGRALFLLGIRSGFRISELLSLRIKDVYQDGRFPDQISVSRANMKKKVEGRTVYLHREAKEALEKWVHEFLKADPANPQSFLFPSRRPGSRAMNRKRAWDLLTKAYKKTGLMGKLGTHCMRKTFAKRVYEALDHDLLALKEALGHKEITSTTKYVAFEQEKVKAAVLKD